MSAVVLDNISGHPAHNRSCSSIHNIPYEEMAGL